LCKRKYVLDWLLWFHDWDILQVKAIINKGKDFTLHSIEINAIAEPGSYVAFAAMPNDLYSKGMNDGLTENNVSLLTYI
jgi:hypothetical protein